MNPFRWLNQFFLPKKPTREELLRARRGILSELDTSIIALHKMPASKEHAKTIKQLEQFRKQLRGDFRQAIDLKRRAGNQPVLGRNPIREAVLRTSHQINLAHAEERINDYA
ncbi:MAG: hypothetical protein FJY86_02495 [Candidatus Diapherotrites archaeon]|uniref:Uncharacterized protein n=1 Tax=Candidatus Iainarchaeum sp. TaxID=3101447 RepID=A0A8T4C6N4_9ARCH|nr:hypothetical protein [Candidatus Diapherotrites archaeon]